MHGLAGSSGLDGQEFQHVEAGSSAAELPEGEYATFRPWSLGEHPEGSEGGSEEG